MNENKFENFLDSLQKLKVQGDDLVVVTLVQIVGAAPQELGAKMIVSARGLEYGTVGGGKVEKRSIEEAQALLSSPSEKPVHHQWNLQKDIGMTCGGMVHLFFEILRFKNPWTIAVFGAGHIVQELVPLLTKLSAQVICIDPRSEWLDKLPKTKNLKLICKENMASVVDDLPENCSVVISTMGHAFDLPILTRVMEQRERFAYVGNIGSAQKALRLKNDLKVAGIPENQLENFFCPVGEDFGNNTPIEIAFSIVAQILRQRDSR